ncbi:MAG TPA: ATP-binding cassette domain-containing protein, partial [Ramlibacter sp.]|nr:ATP-binding cassette domain-containing protein [Ramlibacter sp.]
MREEEETVAAPLPGQGAPMVDIRGLTSAFPLPGGKRFVVHENLDFSVHRGEVVSLVGGSGTGKTVLLRQILGLEQP